MSFLHRWVPSHRTTGLLLMERASLGSIEEVSEPELRIATIGLLVESSQAVPACAG